MPKALHVQQSLSGGEADPELLERRDAEFYYQSVSRARNVQAQVQGGVKHCGGTWLESPLRNPLTQVQPDDFTVTADNGGTAANLTDADTSTIFQADAASGDDFVLFEIELDATTAIEAVDLTGFFADADDDQVLTVRVKPTGGSWTVLGTMDIRTDARTRRFAHAPGEAIAIDVIEAIIETDGCGQVSIAEVKLWTEDADPADIGFMPFKFSLDQQYVLAATAQNIDVFRSSDGVWLAAVPPPITDAMLQRLNHSQRLDALTLYHEDLRTRLIERQGLETEWNIRDFPFENIPSYAFPGTDYENFSAPVPNIAVSVVGPHGSSALDTFADGNNANAGYIDLLQIASTQAVVEFDLGGEFEVTAVDINAIYLNDIIGTFSCQLTYWNGSAWTNIGAAMALTAAPQNFTRSGLSITARLFRLTLPANDYATGGINLYVGDFAVTVTTPSGSDYAGINAKQDVLAYGGTAGQSFTLTVEGLTTEAIAINSTASVTATNIKNALEALPNVGTGLTVTHQAGSTWRVEFSGSDNEGRPWPLMTGTANVTGLTMFVNDVQQGRFAGEPMFSELRGWPRAGGISQQRQILAGTENLPLHLAASIINDPFDLNSELAAASGGFVWQLDSDQADGIVDMIAARNLIVFTENEAYFNAANTLSATEAPDFRKIDQVGVEPGVPIVPIEGGLLFVERGGHVIRQMQYTETQQSYATGALSTLAGHLLNSPVDMARRRPIAGDRADLVHVVNADGTVILLTVQRAEEVIGFTLAQYAGQVKAVIADENGVTRFAVRRTLGGVTRNWLERHDPDAWLECGTRVTGTDMTEATGLGAYEGETVRVLNEGGDEGLTTVASGTVQVGSDSDEIVIGFDLFPEVIDMPVNKDEEAGKLLSRLKRVHTVKLTLFETTSCAVQVNGGPVYDLPLDEISQITYGSSIADRPFSGTVELQGFMGFTETGQVRVTQVRPGSFNLQKIVKEMVV